MRQVPEATIAGVGGQKKVGKVLETYPIPGGRTAGHP